LFARNKVERMEGRMKMASFVGERDGRQFEITVDIGQPYQWGTDPEEWACQVALRGLHENLPDVHGLDAFQAFCLAARFVLTLLA